MAAKIDIPQVFTPSDPVALKRDLERFAQGVYKYALGAPALFLPAPAIAPANVLAFGCVTRVNIQSGATVALQLPQPDAKNGGKVLYIKRETTTGTCRIRGVGATINGRATKLLPAMPALYTIYFDGANYYSEQPLAADWGG